MDGYEMRAGASLELALQLLQHVNVVTCHLSSVVVALWNERQQELCSLEHEVDHVEVIRDPEDHARTTGTTLRFNQS